MAPFRFRFQTLQRLREDARDKCREHLAEALRIDETLQLQQAELDQNLRLARQLQTVQAGRVDVDRLIQAQRYEGAVTAELRHVVDQRSRVAEEIERRRLALVEADREVKVLEKLRDARRREHELAEQRADMKRLDEAAGRRKAEEVYA